MNSTRAVHRSLAHLLPKGCCCAVAPQRTVCQATAAADAPVHDRSQHAPLPQPLVPRRATPLPRRQRRRGHRRGLARRDDEAPIAAPRQDREVRRVRRVPANAAGPGAYIHPHARPREVPGTWLRSHPTAWTWTGTRTPRGAAARPERGLGYSFSCGPVARRTSAGTRPHGKTKNLRFFDDFDVAADTVNDGDYYASDSLVAEARRRLRKTDPSKKEVTTVKDDKMDPRNLSDIATDLDAALGTLTQRLSCTDLLPQESQAYETPLYDATPSHVEMKGPQTLSQISETLDAALYTFTKSYQAKEAAEKAAQEEIEKQRGLERAEIEKEIRAKHSLELMEAAIALGECDMKVEGREEGGRRLPGTYKRHAPVSWMARSRCLPPEERLPQRRRLPLPARAARESPVPAPRRYAGHEPPSTRAARRQRPTGSLNDVSQGIGAELDLALGLMQKRLGAEQMVAKDGDVKPDAKPKVMEDPESKGSLMKMRRRGSCGRRSRSSKNASTTRKRRRRRDGRPRSMI